MCIRDSFYGAHPNVKPNFSGIACPVLGLFAEKDGFVSPATVTALVAEIEAAGKTIEHHTYAGVDHAFFNDHRPDVYNKQAADDAWQRTLTFLNAHL